MKVHRNISLIAAVWQMDLKSSRDLPPSFGGYAPEYHNSWTLTVRP